MASITLVRDVQVFEIAIPKTLRLQKAEFCKRAGEIIVVNYEEMCSLDLKNVRACRIVGEGDKKYYVLAQDLTIQKAESVFLNFPDVSSAIH